MRTIKDLIGKEIFSIIGTDDELLQAEELLLKNGGINDDKEWNDRNRCNDYGNGLSVFSDCEYLYLATEACNALTHPENIFTFSEFLTLIPE